MFIFYVFLFLYCLSAILYYYKNKFKNNNEFISLIFKKILNLLGYRYDIIDISKLPSKLIIIGSHTSIYDFFIGIIFYYAILHEKYDTYILMKQQFEVICTPFLMLIDKRFKLISVEPKKKGLTEHICNNLKDKDNYLLFIAPEGTRRCTYKLKSGYWYISKKLDIDIIYIGIDFSFKYINLEKSRKIRDTWEEEQEEFIYSCKKYIPMYPERCYWTKDYYN